MFDDSDDFPENFSLGEFIEKYDGVLKKIYLSLHGNVRVQVIAKALRKNLEMGLDLDMAISSVVLQFRGREEERDPRKEFLERMRRRGSIRFPRERPDFEEVLYDSNCDYQKGPKFLLDPLEADIITILLESIGEKLDSKKIIKKLAKLGYNGEKVKRHLGRFIDKWINQIRAERFANITVMEPADDDELGFKEFDN